MALERNDRVLVRTNRGLEIASVLGPVKGDAVAKTAVNVLRTADEQDEILVGRLERDKPTAIEKCRVHLAELGSSSTLLDIDHLFDGTLILHFLGDVDEIAESSKTKIAEVYESIVQSQAVAQQLAEGCGPDCGTKTGGCSSGGCGSCKVKCVSSRTGV